MARRDAAPAMTAYARRVADELERPRAPWSVKLVGLAVVIIVAWVVLFPLLNVAASLLALALYVVIAFLAYQVGKAVGRASRD
jgi:hypothetical protein